MLKGRSLHSPELSRNQERPESHWSGYLRMGSSQRLHCFKGPSLTNPTLQTQWAKAPFCWQMPWPWQSSLPPLALHLDILRHWPSSLSMAKPLTHSLQSLPAWCFLHKHLGYLTAKFLWISLCFVKSGSSQETVPSGSHVQLEIQILECSDFIYWPY